MIISLIITLMTLSFMVFFHELGHFISARYFDIPVEEFSIGIGPKLMSIKGNITSYSFRIIPLGGYVKIKGMESIDEEDDVFRKRKFYEKFIVVISGVVMNFILAFMIFLGINLVKGNINLKSTTINKISNIDKSVFKLGDKILYVKGIKINKWNEFIDLVSRNEKDDLIEVDIKRDDKLEKVYIKNEEKIQIMNSSYPWEKSILGSIKMSFIALKNCLKNSFNSILGLIKGKYKNVSGPIGIIKNIKENTNNIFKLLLIAAYMSISLGVFNLLPFPSLDGGRLVFVILEALKIRVNKKVEEYIHLAGFIILILFTLFLSKNDISKLRN